MRRVLIVGVATLACAGVAMAEITAASGWAVRSIPTPQPVQGGVVARDGAVVVGQGSFGAGLQSVVRIAGGTWTVLAAGFNSLGGFALAPDGTLYVVDNGGELGGATTGDTLYAIPDALGRATAVTAADAAVVPAGTFPSAADVLRLPSGRLLVSESTGPGVGRIAAVDGTSVSTLVADLDYASGLALAGPTLLLAHLDGSFTGAVLRFGLDGMALAPLATSLAGAYAVDVDGDGLVLVSGSDAVLAVDAGGSSTVRASGFGFSTELFFDAQRDETLVLDAGASAVTAICRDADADTVCDADAASTTTTTTSSSTTTTTLLAPCGEGAADVRAARLVIGRAKPTVDDGQGPVRLRARVVVETGLPHALPRQEGVSISVVGEDGALVRLDLPGGDGWRRVPSSGWKYSGTLPGGGGASVRARVAGRALYVSVRTSGGGTVPARANPAPQVVQIRSGSVCGEGVTPSCRRRREQLRCP